MSKYRNHQSHIDLIRICFFTSVSAQCRLIGRPRKEKGKQIQRKPGVTFDSFSKKPSGSSTCHCKALVQGTSFKNHIQKTGPAGTDLNFPIGTV